MRLLLFLALSTISGPPQFLGTTPWRRSDASKLFFPFTNFTSGVVARRLLDAPMPQRHYALTNIHALSGIQTQTLRHSSQRQ
ncbi:hypothetical protein TNCV_763841 [Trichonephila clavipes]|nr:hypothetical protein TNCV_763841 [Trichonephila clavipes]